MEYGLLLGEVPVHLLPCRGALKQGDHTQGEANAKAGKKNKDRK